MNSESGHEESIGLKKAEAINEDNQMFDYFEISLFEENQNNNNEIKVELNAIPDAYLNALEQSDDTDTDAGELEGKETNVDAIEVEKEVDGVEWVCKKCQLVNIVTIHFCRMCKAPREGFETSEEALRKETQLQNELCEKTKELDSNNSNEETRCSVCYTPRGSRVFKQMNVGHTSHHAESQDYRWPPYSPAILLDQHWNCDACTYENPPLAPVCAMCGTRKGSKPPVDVSEEERKKRKRAEEENEQLKEKIQKLEMKLKESELALTGVTEELVMHKLESGSLSISEDESDKQRTPPPPSSPHKANILFKPSFTPFSTPAPTPSTSPTTSFSNLPLVFETNTGTTTTTTTSGSINTTTSDTVFAVPTSPPKALSPPVSSPSTPSSTPYGEAEGSL